MAASAQAPSSHMSDISSRITKTNLKQFQIHRTIFITFQVWVWYFLESLRLQCDSHLLNELIYFKILLLRYFCNEHERLATISYILYNFPSFLTGWVVYYLSTIKFYTQANAVRLKLPSNGNFDQRGSNGSFWFRTFPEIFLQVVDYGF